MVWNKALCFGYITCTMGLVGGYNGGSQQADKRFHVCRGGGGAGGNHAGQADEGGGGVTLARDCINHRRLQRREGRLDQAREGRTGGRGCRKSYRESRKVNLLGWKRRSPSSFQVGG
jgi:hypothetical protein